MIARFREREIHYWQQGEGTPLLLLHGFLETASMWEQLADSWRVSHRVIALDLPGHGKSQVFGYVHSMEEMAGAAMAVLKALKIDSCSIIGHSMGGYVALAFAELYPEHLKALVLLNSTSLADSPVRILNRKRALKLLDRNHKSFVKHTIPALFVPETRENYGSAIRRMQDEAALFPKEGISATVRGMMKRPDRTQVLRELNIPRILVYGASDPLIPSELSEKNAEEAKCLGISVAGGHMLHLENRSEIVKIVHFIE